MIKKKIHPGFEKYEAFVDTLVSHGYKEVKVLWNRRNTVEVVDMPDGVRVVVKRFRPVGFFRGVFYTFFGKSKARKAYENAEFLLKEGIDTAQPIAYVERYTLGIFRQGYLVTDFLPYATVKDMYAEEPDGMGVKPVDIRRGVVAFLVNLLNRGIVPGDFNMDNVFYHRDETTGDLKFSLIDVNRLRRRAHTDRNDAAKALMQLGVNIWMLSKFVIHYCRLTGDDADIVGYEVMRKVVERKRRKNLGHRLRSIFK